MRRPLLAVLAVPAAALALAACGGTSVEDYDEDFQPVNEQIQTIGNDVGDAVVNAKGKSNEELARQFSALADRARTAAADVGELEPPDDPESIKKDQEQLEAALNQGARDLDSVASAAQAGNEAAAAAAVAKLVADSDDIRKPRQRIEQAIDQAEG